MATVSEMLPRVDHIARVIDAEFDEMPGMRLTSEQVRRLWGLTEHECSDALDHLCEAGRLARDGSGRFMRRRFEY